MGGCQTGGARFLVQSRRFLVVQKFIYLNLGSNIWILAPRTWVLALYIWILAPKFENRVFFEGCWGVVGGSPRTSGRFRHWCREKMFRPPLDRKVPTDDQGISPMQLLLRLGLSFKQDPCIVSPKSVAPSWTQVTHAVVLTRHYVK